MVFHLGVGQSPRYFKITSFFLESFHIILAGLEHVMLDYWLKVGSFTDAALFARAGLELAWCDFDRAIFFFLGPLLLGEIRLVFVGQTRAGFDGLRWLPVDILTIVSRINFIFPANHHLGCVFEGLTYLC